MFVNERGLLIALLKLTLCFTKKKELIINDHNSLANNIEIQLQLISGTSTINYNTIMYYTHLYLYCFYVFQFYLIFMKFHL